MNQHTPGPWNVANYVQPNGDIPIEQLEGKGAKVVAKVQHRSYSADTDQLWAETRANASLISAAPEMLTALKGVWEYMEMHKDDKVTLGECIISLRALIGPALSKAEGVEE